MVSKILINLESAADYLAGSACTYRDVFLLLLQKISLTIRVSLKIFGLVLAKPDFVIIYVLEGADPSLRALR